MRTILNSIIAIASLLSITSCGPLEVSADLPDRGGLITIIGVFTADSTWNIDVTSSKSILDTKAFYGLGETDIDQITNAQVIIRENGQVQDNLIYSPKTFIVETWEYRSSNSNIHPLPGKTYDIEVTVPGVGTATSTSFVPSPVRLTSAVAGTEITTISSHRINGSFKDLTGFQAVPVDIEIDDPDGKNFYEIIVKLQTRDVHSSLIWQATPLFTRDMRFHNTGLTPGGKLLSNASDEYYSVLFSDNDAQAKQLKLSLMMPVLLEYVDGQNAMRTDVIYSVVLRTLSKECFQYLASQELQSYSDGDPFAQPVVVYGNVKGGLGIFAGVSEYAIEAVFR
jgi:hypothetical protein